MKTSILALALDCPTTAYAQHNRGALPWIGIASTPRRCRPVTTLCLRRGIRPMRDSHTAFPTFLRTKIAQIAMIPRFFDFACNGS
jgi:hypothetical protein